MSECTDVATVGVKGLTRELSKLLKDTQLLTCQCWVMNNTLQKLSALNGLDL